MTIPQKKPPYLPEEETSWEIERQTEAFLQKLIELNRKQQGEDKKEKLELDDELL